jgi:hypothetical protein
MRKALFIVTFLAAFLLSIVASAQSITKANWNALKRSEDSMKLHARKMIQDMNAADRFMADSIFIRTLVKSLRTPNSFYYPFDSLETVSRLYAPDSSFRIFSWQFTRDDNFFRQRGAIQMKTDDGSLKLFPLFDMSDYTTAPQDSVRTPQNWVGAIYYGIIMKTYNNRKYYTLLGFDDNNVRSTKKWIEVLTFDKEGRPVFGGPYFSIEKENPKASKSLARFNIEYKKVGRARMNYDRELDMIVFDHLISEDNQPDKPFTLVPDGDYEGFKWDKGYWVHVDKVFDFKLKDGEAPVPEPLKDDAGNSNETRLMELSEKNGLKRPAATPVKKPAAVTPKRDSKKDNLKRQPKDETAY